MKVKPEAERRIIGHREGGTSMGPGYQEEQEQQD